nr:MAG: hypothetical protein 1 [Leviviridae sp.]
MAKLTQNSTVHKLDFKYRSSQLLPWSSGTKTFTNTFAQVSTSHAPAPYRSGGNWIMSRERWNFSPSQASIPTYAGPLVVTSWATADIGLPMPAPLTASQEKANAMLALSRAWPQNPESGLVNFLIELKRDGVPDIPTVNLWKEKTRLAKGSGSEYLNWQFGWAPLISDMRKFARAVRDADKILSQYRADANHPIDRNITLPAESETKVLANVPLVILPTQSGFSGTGFVTLVSQRNQWFKGKFLFHLPMGKDFLSRMRRYYKEANKLYGVNLDPVTVWNAAPWSWAIDWVADINSFITNVTRNGIDGKVLQYGFFMHNSMLERHFTGTAFKGSYQVPVNTLYKKEYKARAVASPYGFGIDLKALSDRQKAIILALGVTSGGGRRAY